MGGREFQQILRDAGTYETPGDSPRSATDRLLGRFDSWFYWKIYRIVVRTGNTVKKGRFNVESWSDLSYDVIRTIEQCGGRIKIEGFANAAAAPEPAVFIANHMSLVETLMLPVMLLQFNLMTTVVKESLMKYPLFGTVMQGVNPVTVTRQNPRDDLRTVLNKGSEFLREGRSLVIYPQSTRSVEFHPDQFNTLGVKLARKAGVPVIPVALKTDFIGIGRLLRDFGAIDRSKTIRFRFGEHLEISGSGKDEHNKVTNFISETLKEWKDEEPVS